MQRLSALTFELSSACCICYFIPSHSAWEGFVLALGGLLIPPCTTKSWKKVSERADKLRCIMGISVAQFSTAYFQKVLNICVLLHRPPFGHLKSSSFQPKPFQMILGSVAPQYWNWKQNSRHPAWDYCRRQNSMAAAPFSYNCTSACGISKLFTCQNSLMSVHIRNSR